MSFHRSAIPIDDVALVEGSAPGEALRAEARGEDDAPLAARERDPCVPVPIGVALPAVHEEQERRCRVELRRQEELDLDRRDACPVDAGNDDAAVTDRRRLAPVQTGSRPAAQVLDHDALLPTPPFEGARTVPDACATPATWSTKARWRRSSGPRTGTVLSSRA